MISGLKIGVCAEIFRKLGRKYENVRNQSQSLTKLKRSETGSVWIVSRRSERNSDNNTLLSEFTIVMILNLISVISEPGIHCEGFNLNNSWLI